MRVEILESAMDDLRAGRRFYSSQGGRELGSRFFETLADGDEGLASERAEIIRGLPSWKASPESEELAARLIQAHAIPETEDDDARHVAVAAVGGADVLLTWNCRHINNAMTLSKTVEIIGQAGFVCPVITDPAQLLRQMEYTP